MTTTAYRIAVLYIEARELITNQPTNKEQAAGVLTNLAIVDLNAVRLFGVELWNKALNRAEEESLP